MSYSVFKEQKGFNFRPHVSAAFPLKRRITYQTRWMSQPLFVKNVLKDQTPTIRPVLSDAHMWMRMEIISRSRLIPSPIFIGWCASCISEEKDKTRLRATLPRSAPQYHRRWGPSLLCSEWEQVFPPRYGNRKIFKNLQLHSIEITTTTTCIP